MTGKVGGLHTGKRLYTPKGRGSLVVLVVLMGALGCEFLRESKPIVPMQEYELMLIGRLDADYVGTDTCLSACHFHDQIKTDFDASTMGAQLSEQSGLPLVNCESCHGPGSLAIAGITPELVATEAAAGRQTACKYDTFLDLKKLPPPAQSLLCQKCHTKNATFSLHNWAAGAHAYGDVSCFDCHDIHAGPDLKASPRETNNLCLRCHPRQRMEFQLPSRHPVLDNRFFCVDCHDPHGTVAEGLLREETLKETCTLCHGAMEGPYLFEHADLNDDCATCHSVHGSVNDNLLKVREPFLCLQCHGGHRTSSDPVTEETKGAFFTRCTDCHSQIHGTDLPSVSGQGGFLH